ncbi:gastric triacylglycerol lipase-like [Corticium candelabrum]|uniref:gastric triacylglycerol lipase-like n=1 Tax=Corticium candelabrum TaxID=121492 RepID=UPI002E25B53F|nr:gastric triacylglycerol lipase-like [Corticium candelabrum]
MQSFTPFLVFCCVLHCVTCEDPEFNLTARQLILYNGYPEEDHWVTTSDGFILGLQRIPHGKHGPSSGPRPVFFLQHALLCSSTTWLTNVANESLAFLLADEGYDVWLGNVRGNTYSRNHTKLSPSQSAFWSWSWDEMALLDLPAMINYVIEVTNQTEIFYVGHSQGTVMGFAGFSVNQVLASHIKAFFALAPVAHAGHIKGLLRVLAVVAPEIEDLLHLFGVKDFLPNTELTKFIAQYVCVSDIAALCADVLFLTCGFDVSHFNETRLPVYLSHTPAGTSVQNVIHFVQEVNSNKFQMYDYGSPQANADHYSGMTAPPVYNLTDFHVPVYTYQGTNDWLADSEDVVWLKSQLSSLQGNKTINGYEHLDFIWATDVATQVYGHIIDEAKKLLQ